MDQLLHDYPELLDADKQSVLGRLKENYEDIQNYSTKKITFEDMFEQ